MAVSRTDVTQALLMLVSLLIMVVALAGWTENPFLEIGNYSSSWLNPFNTGDGEAITFAAASSMAGWAVGGLGAQRILQRFMALEREDQVKRSRRISVAWLISVFVLAVMLGLIARPALAEIGMLDLAADPELVYLVMAEWDIQPATPGFIIATVAAVTATWMTPPPATEVLALFDKVNGPEVSGAATTAET